ncbi:MAG: nucleotide-binding protein [Chloroflexi bacterium]|nr:nucleotide-binding protein [Chloroflexota bacterium]
MMTMKNSGATSYSDLSSTIDTLTQFSREVDDLQRPPYDDYKKRLWVDKVRDYLELKLGKESKEYDRFRGASSYNAGESRQERSLKDLSYYKSDLISIIQRLEQRAKKGVVTLTPSTSSQPEQPKVFIAHGGTPPALKKLKEFLEALGVRAIIAEDEPSEGRSVDDHVTWCMDQSDCYVVLATKDHVKGDKVYAAENVYIEIGRFQERKPNRVIYLLEEGASFPSNIVQKVWEKFTSENMERAFIKVAKELRAFGLLHAGKSN